MTERDKKEFRKLAVGFCIILSIAITVVWTFMGLIEWSVQTELYQKNPAYYITTKGERPTLLNVFEDKIKFFTELRIK
ncbi:hypothetical protein ACFLQL_00410 [Verrucomicrobiota bacterium]